MDSSQEKDAKEANDSNSLSEGCSSSYSNQLSFDRILQGILVAPQVTYKALLNTPEFFNEKQAAIGLVLVSLIGISASLCQSAGDIVPLILLKLVFAVFSSIMSWMIIALFLFILARRSNRFATVYSVLVLTAWAHVPLILFPPIYCLQAALGGIAEILLGAVLIWYVALNFIAFKAVLEVSYKKLLTNAFLIPPVIAISMVFWTYFLVSYTTLRLLSLLI